MPKLKNGSIVFVLLRNMLVIYWHEDFVYASSLHLLYIYQYINNVEIYIHYQGQLSPLIFNVNVQDFVKVEKPLLQNTFPTSTSPLAQNVPVTIL